MKQFVSLLRLTNIINQIAGNERASSLIDLHTSGLPADVQDNIAPFIITEEDEFISLTCQKTRSVSGGWNRPDEIPDIGGLRLEYGNVISFPYIMELELLDEYYPWLTEQECAIIKQTAYLSACLAYYVIYDMLGVDDITSFLSLPAFNTGAMETVTPVTVLQALELTMECRDEWASETKTFEIKRYLKENYAYTPTAQLTNKAWERMSSVWVAAGCSVTDIINHINNQLDTGYTLYPTYHVISNMLSLPLLMCYFIMEQQTSYYKQLSQDQYHLFEHDCEQIFREGDYIHYVRNHDDDFVIRESHYGWVTTRKAEAVINGRYDADYQFIARTLKHILMVMEEISLRNISNISIDDIKNVTTGNINVILNTSKLSWEPVSEVS